MIWWGSKAAKESRQPIPRMAQASLSSFLSLSEARELYAINTTADGKAISTLGQSPLE